jgi:hypothetical protein
MSLRYACCLQQPPFGRRLRRLRQRLPKKQRLRKNQRLGKNQRLRKKQRPLPIHSSNYFARSPGSQAFRSSKEL